MFRQHLALWIVGSAVVCAGLGAFGGHELGDGRAGNIALISAVCAVLGSFLPGAMRWARTRLRERPPHHGRASDNTALSLDQSTQEYSGHGRAEVPRVR